MTSDELPKGPSGGFGLDRGPGGEVGDEAASVIELSGVIKWFDVSKGFGFIVPDNGMPDILLHVTCLRRDGYQVAYEGARVIVEVLQRPRACRRPNPSMMSRLRCTGTTRMPRTHVTVAPMSGLSGPRLSGSIGCAASAFHPGHRHFRAYGDARRFGLTELRPGHNSSCAPARPKGLMAEVRRRGADWPGPTAWYSALIPHSLLLVGSPAALLAHSGPSNPGFADVATKL
jgi:CspA family cold shock protein